jgi:hypothetical protein
LEYARDQALFWANHDFDAEISWPSFCHSELEWWLMLCHPVSATFKSPRFSIHMTTDASLEGWAAIVGDSSASGTWDEADADDISLLEMKAVLLGLQSFFDSPAPITIHLSTNNTVTKAYVNHMGGCIGRYDAMARRIWAFLEQRDMFLVAFYVPSAENCADALTRLGNTRRSDRIIALEFQLIPRWFPKACTLLHVSPSIDWFASDDTAQLELFAHRRRLSTPRVLMLLRTLGLMKLVISFLLSPFSPGSLPRSSKTEPTDSWWSHTGRERPGGVQS